MTIQLRKASFRKWLQEKHPDQHVGRRRQPDCCPLAHFLADLGATEPSVQMMTFHLKRGDRPRVLPRWAYEFRRDVDRTPDPVLAAGGVTAAHALQLLEAANA